MLKKNCKVGMKVITTGLPSSERGRSESETCIAETNNGYSIIKALNEENVLISSIDKQWHTRFYYKQVHPYFGDKHE